MSHGIKLVLNLADYLGKIHPDLIKHLQMTIDIGPPVDTGFPECLNRLHFQNYLHLIGARNGAEIGVQKAEYSEHLLKNWDGRLYLIDPWEHQENDYVDVANVEDGEHERNYRGAVERVAPFGSRVKIIRRYSVEAARLFEDESLDFVYLDGNHCYKAVQGDLNAWLPKVRPGGLIAGHDFIDLHQDGLTIEVRSAVIDYVAGRWPVFVSKELWPTLWYFKKV